jgi:hydrogenase-4 membrane subunit HyfE
MKTIKSYLIVAILVLLAIILISDKLLIWGIGVLTSALIILGIQQTGERRAVVR